MGRMERILKHMRRVFTVFPVLLLLAAACAKGDYMADIDRNGWDYKIVGDDTGSLAVGTVKSRDGVRYIQLDAVSTGFVVNPSEIKAIADGTRVFLEYLVVLSTETPDFCSDAILVEWATPLDVGDRSILNFEESFSEESFLATDPVDIVPDWITSLEDGFLTLHYTVRSSGEKKHTFSLYEGMGEGGRYFFVHDANGDTGRNLTDGIVCFPMADLLPETENGTVTITVTYLNLNKTKKTLTVEYRSPK